MRALLVNLLAWGAEWCGKVLAEDKCYHDTCRDVGGRDTGNVVQTPVILVVWSSLSTIQTLLNVSPITSTRRSSLLW